MGRANEEETNDAVTIFVRLVVFTAHRIQREAHKQAKQYKKGSKPSCNGERKTAKMGRICASFTTRLCLYLAPPGPDGKLFISRANVEEEEARRDG